MDIYEIFDLGCNFLFENIINSLDSWVLIADSDKKILWANKSFFKLIKHTKKSVINKKADSIPFIKKSPIDKMMKICIGSNKKSSDEVDIEIGGKNYFINIKMIPISLKKIKKSLVLVIMENVTQVSSLFHKVKETRSFFEMIFNGIRVYSIFTTGLDFNIQRFNKGSELLFEYSATEAEGILTIKDLLPADSLGQLKEIMDVLKVLNLVRREVKMKNKKGEVIFADLTITKIIDEDQKHIGYIFLASDITEHRKLKVSIEKQNVELALLYQETQRANKAKSVFLANMSHELRTPLTAILGFSELLMDEKIGSLSAKQKDFMNDIHTSGTHLLSLINDVLDLSKIEADRLDINIEEVCLNDIIDSAETFILPQARKKEIDLINETPKKRVFIKADSSRLKQVLYNLYSNSIKFTPEKGKVTTRVKTDKKKAEISVIDTGVGIVPEHQEMVFEEFFQIESPYTKRYAGTGLGLTLVKRFVEMMDGTISVFSEGKNKGAAFTVTLPLS
ncbi:MAG: PAS domain-containing protein [Spirochaetes bacterium]|nr:PAS domain-containing protein [Spirochaetota bacterium]